jgi:outer membrane protein TolC
MNFMQKYFLMIILLGSITNGFGQDKKEILKLSISDAQTFALQNNRTVQSSKIDIQSANKKIWENLATGLPQLNVAANYLHQFVVPQLNLGMVLNPDNLPASGPITKTDITNAYEQSPTFALGVHDNTVIDFTLSQLIFSGEYLVGLQATKVVKEMTEKSLEKTENATKELVAGTYHLILVLGENEKVLNQSLQSVDQTYTELVKMNEQGLNEETDVDQVKISKSNIQTLITSIESQKQISIKLLKYQLGLGFDQNIELTDSLPGIIEQGKMQYLTSSVFDINNSIDYKLVAYQDKISALMLKREKSKYLPTISAFYRHEEQTNMPAFNFAVKDVVGANLTLPIFSSGMRNARVSQAKFDLQKSELAKADAGQGLTMEFETARSTYQTAFSNFNTNKESMDLSKKVYDKTVIKYKEGVSSSFELTQNQNQYLTAESNYYNSILSLLNAKAKLDRILSTGK